MSVASGISMGMPGEVIPESRPEPDISPVPGSDRLYQLNHPFWVYVKGIGWIGILDGFRTDGASIPRWCWPLCGHPFQPKVLSGAVCHDALCQSGLVSRPVADACFLKLMRRYNVAPAKRRVFWAAVRAAGICGYPHYAPATVGAARKLVRIVADEE